jgi:hypothetical protein
MGVVQKGHLEKHPKTEEMTGECPSFPLFSGIMAILG